MTVTPSSFTPIRRPDLPHGPDVVLLRAPRGGKERPEGTRVPELGPALSALTQIVRERAASRPEGSYTAALLKAGTRRIAQKVGEEGVEVALAAAAGSTGEVVNESVDLLYHLLVLLEDLGIDGRDVAAEVTRRFPAQDR